MFLSNNVQTTKEDINQSIYSIFRSSQGLPLLFYIHHVHQRSMGWRKNSWCFCKGISCSPSWGIRKYHEKKESAEKVLKIRFCQYLNNKWYKITNTNTHLCKEWCNLLMDFFRKLSKFHWKYFFKIPFQCKDLDCILLHANTANFVVKSPSN